MNPKNQEILFNVEEHVLKEPYLESHVIVFLFVKMVIIQMGDVNQKKNNTTTEVKKCSPGYYYSKKYKRCCKVGIKGGPCGPKNPKPIKFIDN